MKYYLIKLRLIIGYYEKHVNHLIQANNLDEAVIAAFEAESHHDDASLNESMDAWEDCGGEMLYKVQSSRELNSNEYKMLKLYI